MKLKRYIHDLVIFSLPIMLGQLGQMLIFAGDVYIAGQYSTVAVASIGIATGFINPIFLFGIGLMMGISPALAIMKGKEEDSSGSLLSLSIYSLLVGGALTVLALVFNQFIGAFGLEENLVPLIQEYIEIVAWSFPPALLFQAIKEFLQGNDKVFLPNALSLIAVVLNLFINYVLVFGFAGFEGMGQVGLAYASLSIRIILAIVMVLCVVDYIKIKKVSYQMIKHIFKFSLPVAFMFFLEVLAFCSVSILSGKLGVVEAAANNIIMTVASIAFMVPLSISSAVAVKVGNSFGANDYSRLKSYSLAGVITVLSFVVFSASTFFFLPELIMKLMTKDLLVIDLGVKLLFIVAIFQLADGMQVLLSGVLRGMNDTHTSSILVFFGYWMIGIPIGIYFAFYGDKGAEGLWIGLALSLSIVAVLLWGVLNYRFKRFTDLKP